ncbi:hypothetical protein TNCV_3436901 [Trichonephila clavipes]|nr:hypothetical protein TNCV_3436901 [Trichonephila clavipes]
MGTTEYLNKTQCRPVVINTYLEGILSIKVAGRLIDFPYGMQDTTVEALLASMIWKIKWEEIALSAVSKKMRPESRETKPRQR